MHYSYTALALALASTVIAQPGKHHARHGHANFHAKKNAPEPEKRDIDWAAALADVNWDSALADVDWSTVKYGGGSSSTSSSVVAAPAPTTTTSAVQQAPPAPSTTVVATTLSTSATAAATTAATTSSSSSSSGLGGVVSTIISEVEELALVALGVCSVGTNAESDSSSVWIGTDGPYTMDINNESGEDIWIVAWGPSGSWVNVDVPLITLKFPAGSSKTLSFSNGASGALSAFYSDTSLVNGQLSNTWVEFTMAEEGVFDVSREVNMNGHTVEVVGPSCTSNMSTCVFKCKDSSVTSCEYDYELVNCANGSQKGAQYGTYAGAASGGCGGLGSSASMTATFS